MNLVGYPTLREWKREIEKRPTKYDPWKSIQSSFWFEQRWRRSHVYNKFATVYA